MRIEMGVVSSWSGLQLFCRNHPGLLLVIIGVIGEIICEWDKEKGVRGRLIKLFGFLLVAGLLLEIWEAVKTDALVADVVNRNLVLANRLKDVDPLNAPINSASAVVRLTVKGVKSVPILESHSWGIFQEPTPDEVRDWGTGGIGFYQGTNTSKMIYRLSCGGQNFRFLGAGLVGGSNDMRGIDIHFHYDEDTVDESFFPTAFASPKFEVGQAVGTFTNVGSFVISLPPLETNVVVISGTVQVKVNSSRWSFPIPAQTPRYGLISSQLTTNAAKQIEAKILTVPVSDISGNPIGVYDGK